MEVQETGARTTVATGADGRGGDINPPRFVPFE